MALLQLPLEEEHAHAVMGCGTVAKNVREQIGFEYINFYVLEQKLSSKDRLVITRQSLFVFFVAFGSLVSSYYFSGVESTKNTSSLLDFTVRPSLWLRRATALVSCFYRALK